MNKSQSIHDFWNSFGLKAYDENSVPDNAQFPYITYSVVTDSLEYVVLLSGSIWYRTTSWEAPSLKAEEISNALAGGKVIKLNEGYLYIYRGTPFAQRLKYDADDTIKHIYFNINAEFLSN